MTNLSHNAERNLLRNRMCKEVDGLSLALSEHRTMDAALMIHAWISSKASYPQRDLLILHWKHSVLEILDMMDRGVGGVWCGGAAHILTYALNCCNVRACTYAYGAGSVSHETTVFGQTINDGKSYQFYILDAYLNFHYVYAGTATWMPLPEMWRIIRQKRYGDIQRVDERIERELVTSTRDAAFYSWLFDKGAPTKPSRIAGEHSVYSGATHSVSKILKTGPFKEAIDAARGDQPIEEFMLDLMLVRPVFGPITPVPEAYPETSLLRSIIGSFIDEPAWVKELA